jgi:anti-sigma factor RsiW
MNCSTIQTRLSAFADGELSPALRSEIEAHLALCADCRRLLADGDRLWLALEDSNPPRPRPDFTQAVLRKVTTQSGSGIFIDRIRAWARLLPAPAALAAMVVLGLLLGGWMGQTVLEERRVASAPAQEASLEGLDAFTPTPRGSLAQGYLVLVSTTNGVHR